jgi:hypothetical protein
LALRIALAMTGATIFENPLWSRFAVTCVEPNRDSQV